MTERGGVWNDNSGRVAIGCTKADVADLRAALRKLGVKQTTDQTENVLGAALRLDDERATLARTDDFAENLKAFWRAQRATRTAKLKAAGICIQCGKTPCAPRVTCAPCNEARYQRLKAQKAKEKAS